MNESKNSRKKALIIFVLAFLACGGGVFIFFVFQGLGDFKGGGKGSFHYGFNAKKALLPLFNYFSPADSEAEVARKAKKRLEFRGLDVSLLDGSKADVSDWMAKGGGAGGSSGNAGARGASRAVRTAVPRMGGGLGGISGGGGGSQTSAGLARFGGSGDAGNTRISAGKGGQSAVSGKGTMGALTSVRSAMKEGLRSGSAMTAKAKWDQGFGAGAAGKKSGTLAYGKSGLANLDRIKKGDIADLKTLEPGSLSAAVPPPVEDKTAKPNKAEGNTEADIAKQVAAQIAQGLGAGLATGPGAGSSNSGQQDGMPPPDVLRLATTPPEYNSDGVRVGGGISCLQGCDMGADGMAVDSQVSYTQDSNGDWHGIFEGTQGGIPYRDELIFKPGGDPPFEPVGTVVNQDGNWVNADFGTSNVSAGN
ncbi:MAG: hypothetical protein KKH28_00685 [Elusimicrobia bacterium]|nr:hypothetical protein [Elusimicrobiota bacterium]